VRVPKRADQRMRLLSSRGSIDESEETGERHLEATAQGDDAKVKGQAVKATLLALFSENRKLRRRETGGVSAWRTIAKGVR
jgi:hypothetical protein